MCSCSVSGNSTVPLVKAKVEQLQHALWADGVAQKRKGLVEESAPS